ncbi:hypothetical protein [uncultured Cetobacterium sp.]|uniref:hypothetical protein n=1 Tax=uncultured Cetobacterium sp. TaxID=527638 RepID=UPI0026198DF4|nr:hypothetical protein [uncultured Cetobacterium sp.]
MRKRIDIDKMIANTITEVLEMELSNNRKENYKKELKKSIFYEDEKYQMIYIQYLEHQAKEESEKFKQKQIKKVEDKLYCS